MYDTIGGVIVNPPRPNCGCVSTTFTHDVGRRFWLCARCVGRDGLSRPTHCQRCGDRADECGGINRSVDGDVICATCRRARRRRRF